VSDGRDFAVVTTVRGPGGGANQDVFFAIADESRFADIGVTWATTVQYGRHRAHNAQGVAVIYEAPAHRCHCDQAVLVMARLVGTTSTARLPFRRIDCARRPVAVPGNPATCRRSFITSQTRAVLTNRSSASIPLRTRRRDHPLRMELR
jgi:hypothetical protein